MEESLNVFDEALIPCGENPLTVSIEMVVVILARRTLPPTQFASALREIF